MTHAIDPRSRSRSRVAAPYSARCACGFEVAGADAAFIAEMLDRHVCPPVPAGPGDVLADRLTAGVGGTIVVVLVVVVLVMVMIANHLVPTL